MDNVNIEKVVLSDVTKNLDNRRIPLNASQRAEKEENPKYPYIGANNIMGYIDEYLFDEKILCVAEDGGSWGYQETCAKIYNEKVWVNNHAHVLIAKENLVLEYLMYYMNYTNLSLYINGATRGKLTKSSLNSIKIPLPPLPEQKRIATILDAADAYRQKTKALIAKYDELTQSLFLDMFGDPAKNPFSWELKTCGDFIDYLADIGSNGANKIVSEKLVMSDTEDYAVMIRTTNLNRNDFKNNIKYVSKGVYDFFKKSQVFGGEIIMNKIGSAGDFWLMPKLEKPVSLGLNQFLIRLKDINLMYFYHFLSTDYGTINIKSRCNGAATKSITKTAVRELPILLPPIDLQNQFAKRVQAIETQKAQAQTSLKKAEDLFNCLLQKAFKGELTQ